MRYRNLLLRCSGLLLPFLAPAQEEPRTDTALLPEITVRSYEQSRRLRDVPAPVVVINREQLQRFGPASLVAAVNSTAGVRMEERSPGSYRINIRGSALRAPFGVRNIKVYYNDLPFTQPGGTTYLNQLGFYNIASMEVIKGPGSSLYGAGTGGVLLLEGQAEQQQHALQADYTYGSFGSHNAAATLQLGTQQQASTLVVQHQQSEGYRQQSNLRRDVVAWNGRYTLGTGTSIKTTFLYSDLAYGTPGALTAAEFRATPWIARPASGASPSSIAAKAAIKQQLLLAGFSITQNITSNLSNKTALYGIVSRLDNPNLRGYDHTTEPHGGGRTVFSYQPQLPGGTLLLQAGAEAQWGTAQISNTKNTGGRQDSLRYRDDVRQQQSTLFVQGTLTQGDWQVTAGSSLNHYNLQFQRFAPQTLGTQQASFGPVWTGRLALLRKLGNLTLYTSIANGFSPPSTSELLPTGGTINSSLLPEKGTSYDLGARGNWGRLRFDASLFYFALKQTITQRRDAAGGDLYVNSGSTDQKGLELALQYPLLNQKGKRLLLWSSSTHHAFRYRNFRQLTNDYTGKAIPGIIPNNLQAGTDLTWGKWNLLVQHQYADVVMLNDANTARSRVQQLLTAQVRRTFAVSKKMELALYGGGDNLLNQRYSLGYDINAFGGRYFNAAPRRNYFAGVQVRLLKGAPPQNTGANPK